MTKEPGRIQLSGFVAEEITKTKAEEILRTVKGVKSIDNQIQSQIVGRYGYG